MKRWTAKTRAQVWGQKNAWSLAPPDGTTASPTECEIVVEIQGDEKNGFHFVMSPNGFFTADTWSETIDEAFDYGKRLFDLDRDDWRRHDDG